MLKEILVICVLLRDITGKMLPKTPNNYRFWKKMITSNKKRIFKYKLWVKPAEAA